MIAATGAEALPLASIVIAILGLSFLVAGREAVMSAPIAAELPGVHHQRPEPGKQPETPRMSDSPAPQRSDLAALDTVPPIEPSKQHTVFTRLMPVATARPVRATSTKIGNAYVLAALSVGGDRRADLAEMANSRQRTPWDGADGQFSFADPDAREP